MNDSRPTPGYLHLLWVLLFGITLSLLAIAGAALARVQGSVTPTNQWADIYSTHSTFAGQPLAVGDTVAVYDPQDTQCGQFVVNKSGWYGLMSCYGDDPYTLEDEGAVAGDTLHFTINGLAADMTAITHNGATVAPDTVVTWNEHGERWQVDLSVAATSTATPTDTPTPLPSWRFQGTTYRGPPGDESAPLPNVTVRLFARREGELQGVLLQTKVSSDPEGFWSFYEVRSYDYYRLVATVPSGMIATGAWSEDGTVLSPTEIEWFRPTHQVHSSKFFFDFLTPTPTSTPTRTPTPTATPTRTSSPTATPSTGTIQGTVWNDLNGNTIREAGEPGLAGAQLLLHDSSDALIGLYTTGVHGTYVFPGLAPGTYNIEEVDPPGYGSTTPNTWVVPVSANATTAIDFGDQFVGTATATPTATITPTPTLPSNFAIYLPLVAKG
ncbi:MAG: hypothetical protein GXP41_07980 [Chloroflexi bacterium]|nr:hypothetical protein [Chloroflexota bacterium]